MSLQITAYSGLRSLRRIASGEPPQLVRDGITFPVHPLFQRHAEGVDSQVVYSARTQFEFNAGGFSGHIRWLEWLARLVGIDFLDLFWKAPKPAPFADFLDFADGDATIGPVVCAGLARDFGDWASSAAQHQNRSFREKYILWRHAFDVGATNGCVVFCAQPRS